MTDKLPPWIEDIEDFDEPTNILCHGDTGAGKNWLWGRLPNLVVFAVEDGTVSIKKAGITGVKVIRCRSWSDIVRGYEWCRDNPGRFDWILFDSLTKAQALCIRDIMEKVVKANRERDPFIPSKGDHYKWQLSIKQMVMDFNELPTNMVWLARSMVKEDPDGTEIIVPSIEGKDYGISAWVCGEMSLLCYLKKVKTGKGDAAKVTRRLYTNEHPVYWCKDWYNVLPKVIEFDDPKGVADKIVTLLRSDPGAERANKTKPATKPAAAAKKTAGKRGTR